MTASAFEPRCYATASNAVTRKWGAVALAAIWWVTLLLPAFSQVFDPSNGPIVMAGYKVLGAGWIAICYGQLGWLANLALPILLIALTAYSVNDRVARIAALAILAAMLTMIDLAIKPAFHGYPEVLIGGWIWIANNLAAATFAFVVTRKSVSIK